MIQMPDEPKKNKAPAITIDEDILWRLSVLIRDKMGLDYTGDNRADLERGLRRATGDFGFKGADALQRCAEWLVAGPLLKGQIEILAAHLTIGETYFFRDPALFESLRLHIWPALLQLRRATGVRELRIWSAACCTGEEPYSLAMQLHALLPQLLPDWRAWKITILATDLNPVFLKKAESATYSAWSFRSAAREEQKRYFEEVGGGRFRLKAEIRRYVQFARLNLVTDNYPAVLNGTAQQDIIFCRNVLMYFAPEQARTVASNLIRSLNEGGYLVPAASEASAGLFSPLISAPLPGVILYQKTAAAPVERHSPPVKKQVMPNQTRQEKKPSRVLPEANPVKPTLKPAFAVAAPEPSPEVLPEPPDLKLANKWYEKACMAAGLGRLEDALTFCDQAIAENKMAARYYYLRASILLEKTAASDEIEKSTAETERGREREAETALRRALYLEPDFALAHFVLGNLERRRGQAAGARRSWQNALQALQDLPPESLLNEGDELTAGHAAALIERALSTLKES